MCATYENLNGDKCSHSKLLHVDTVDGPIKHEGLVAEGFKTAGGGGQGRQVTETPTQRRCHTVKLRVALPCASQAAALGFFGDVSRNVLGGGVGWE